MLTIPEVRGQNKRKMEEYILIRLGPDKGLQQKMLVDDFWVAHNKLARPLLINVAIVTV